MTALFFTDSDRYIYNLDKALSVEELSELSNTSKKRYTVHLPVIVDTEYQTWSDKHKELLISKNLGSLTLTTQIKSITQSEGQIFCHWNMNKNPQLPKHFPSQSKNTKHVIEDYLKSFGINCELKRASDKTSLEYLKKLRRKRNFRIVMFAHFAVADFLRVTNGSLQSDLEAMMIKPVKGSKITQSRRLRTEYIPYKQKVSKDWVRCDWYITLDGLDYPLEISVQDTGALHGAIGLAGLAANTGTVMDFKEIYTSEEKSDMLTMYLKDPKSFKQYALGDLEVYRILENNSEKFKLIWETLGIDHYFKNPALTIGSTVSSIFEAKIAKLFESVYQEKLDDKKILEVLNTYTRSASSEFLISKEDHTSGLLAKVLGGRCFNNRPLDTVHKGVLVDIDISGCYGEGLRGQLYPLGRPVIIDYPKLSPNNGYLTLREFLKKYRKELVAGLWQLWFSVTDDRSNALNPKPLELVSSQDFFTSYSPPKKWSENLADTEKEEIADPKSWLELPDSTKIFSNQITNAVLTHDGLQWLENICSRPLKNQILDNSIVICAEFYPASQRCDSLEELAKFTEDHNALNTSEMIDDSAGEVVSTDRECKKWFAVSLGAFMVDTLLLERKKHPKKTPLNTLFKLCTNTLYGVMVSKYFKVSNSCVGQNVTARARLMAWCLEKGLHGQQSITDGAVFDLNRVCYGRRDRKINDSNATSTNRFSDRELTLKDLQFKPLNGFVAINWCDGSDEHLEVWDSFERKIFKVSELKKLVDSLALQHLKNEFAGLDILHAKTTDIYGLERDSVFVFETKGIVKAGVFHGSANYFLAGGQHDSYGSKNEMIAFRSYEKRLSASPVNFCKQLLEDPSAITRQNPFTKQTIVKVADFSQRYNSFYKDHVFKAGDSVYSAGILRECSISQFLFLNASQRDSWEKESTYLKENFGQSYEVWFTDRETGKLNYQLMVETLDKAISEGYKSFKSYIDKSKNNPFKALGSHPSFEDYTMLKDRYQLEGLTNTDLDYSEDWLDSQDYEDYENYESEGILVTEDIDW
jgi:hypothetical protein